MQVLDKNNEAFLQLISFKPNDYPAHVVEFAATQKGFTAVIGWDQEKAWLVGYAS